MKPPSHVEEKEHSKRRESILNNIKDVKENDMFGNSGILFSLEIE